LEKEYKKEVVDYMVAEYKKGRTPNPDVMCNKEIKFGHFLKFALKNGADFVATGHYAQKAASSQQPAARQKIKSSKTLMLDASYLLLEGADPNKDQSYFLWTLTQKQLKHILFPIGHLQKSEVRKLADKFGLPQATRKDSQGLCFLGKVDMKEFLSRYIPQKRGDVLDMEGKIIGHHNGALFFTIGERHGFTITQKSDKEAPLYVVAKDINNNTITVRSISKFRPLHPVARDPHGPKFADTAPQGVIIKDINLIGEIKNKNLLCRIRYRQEKQKCTVSKQNNKYQINFDKPQMGVSAGQSLVLYDARPNGSSGRRENCLGGGIIS
jgi:tRNA-specific 2-thiouridylase